MDEPQPPALPETTTPAATSLMARLTNIFVSPGEVFDEVKVSEPNTMNWLVPSILACVLAIGLARMSGVSFTKTAALLFGIWAVIRAGLIVISGFFSPGMK